MERRAGERVDDGSPTGVQPTVILPPSRVGRTSGTGRHVVASASSGRQPTAGAKRTLVTGAPRTTRVIPAIDQTALNVPALREAPSQGQTLRPAAPRHITQARPIRPQDTALVEKTTRVLRAIQIVEPVEALPALWDDEERGPVTVVPRTLEVPVVWTPRPPQGKRPRGLRGHAALWALAVLAVLATVAAVSPLGRGALAQAFHPHGVQLAADKTTDVPNGPWASMSGAAEVLGIGGGAGPGVSAPGSAGLPASKTLTKAPPAPKPAAASSQSSPPSSGISNPPVSPWPPSNPYMSVPGHYAFAVSPNGYYSWAFGQCTWWAQDKRRDENLTYMGNAQFWATGAASRGYRVGSTPAVGATVVFQPGVQGAGGAGHVAHVEAVYPDGWFLVSEMNFYWNGGGWGRVDYRFAHTGWGVQFIY